LAVFRAEAPPLADIRALLVKMDYSGVAIAVGNEYVAVRGERHVRGPEEMPFVRAGFPIDAQRQNDISVAPVLFDHVPGHIRGPDESFPVNLDVMRARRLSPAEKITTVGCIDLHRRRVPRVHPDVAFRIERHTWNAGPRDLRRLLRPVRSQFIPWPRVDMRVFGIGWSGCRHRGRQRMQDRQDESSDKTGLRFHGVHIRTSDGNAAIFRREHTEARSTPSAAP